MLIESAIVPPTMKKTFLLLLLLIGFTTQAFNIKTKSPVTSLISQVIGLSEKFSISKEAIQFAIGGYEKLKKSGQLINLRYLTIADFSKPSSEKRLFIIDLFIVKNGNI